MKQSQYYLKNDFGNKFLGEVLDWVESNMSPDDVFSEEKLEEWAEEAGYIPKEDK